MHCGSVRATKARAILRPKAASSAFLKFFSSIKRTSISGGAWSDAMLSFRLGTLSGIFLDDAFHRIGAIDAAAADHGRADRAIEAANAAWRRADTQIGAEGKRQKTAREFGAREARELRRRAAEGTRWRRLLSRGGQRLARQQCGMAKIDPAHSRASGNPRTAMSPFPCKRIDGARLINPRSLFGAALAHQTFLRHRGDQRPVAGKYKSAGKAARAVQIGRILRVEQPVIGAKRPVQP